jgi:methylated-DNA-[protein]-cysteine S-methyltransferase
MSKSHLHAGKQRFALFDTRLGRCAIAWSDTGVIGVQLPERSAQQTVKKLAERYTGKEMVETKPPQMVREAIARLVRHLEDGHHDLSTITVDFHGAGVPPFHQKVYRAARTISAGKTMSYGDLARLAGSPAAARAVGQAMARNPLPLVVPCHRVLGADGAAVGFSAFGGCNLKERLLAMEGVQRNGSRKTGLRFTPGDPGSLPFDARKAVEHLKSSDKKLAGVIEKVGPLRLQLDEMVTPFEALAESIVYQQLTGKAAATIFTRVKGIWGGCLPAPQRIIATPDSVLRSAGLSAAKTLALKDLSEKQAAGLLPDLQQLHAMTDEEIIETLSQVRGVGRWTVEMLLIFRLGRPDVLPIHDYGVRKGFARVFKKAELPAPKELDAYGKRWAPYRSVAAWYLWRALEL